MTVQPIASSYNKTSSSFSQFNEVTIIQISKIAELIPRIAHLLLNATVFIDLDETTIRQIRDGISYKDFCLWVRKETLSEECTLNKASQTLSWGAATFPSFPAEEDTLAVCKSLQTFARAYLYLTSRKLTTSDLTQTHLRGFPQGLRIPGLAPDGVYFTNHGCKAEAIQHLNRESEEIRDSSVFIFIDDNKAYIDAVAAKCADLGKHIICIHYNSPRPERLPFDDQVDLWLAEDGFGAFPRGLVNFRAF